MLSYGTAVKALIVASCLTSLLAFGLLSANEAVLSASLGCLTDAVEIIDLQP